MLLPQCVSRTSNALSKGGEVQGCHGRMLDPADRHGDDHMQGYIYVRFDPNQGIGTKASALTSSIAFRNHEIHSIILSMAGVATSHEHAPTALEKPEESWIEERQEPISEDAIDAQALRKVIRKVDVIVLPVLTLILAICYIDRANMGLAAVAGMSKELKLVGFQYSTTLLLFFPGYVLFALPSNYVLSKVPVRYWLSILSVMFGIFTLAMGLVHSFSALAAMRVFLGIFEAGSVEQKPPFLDSN